MLLASATAVVAASLAGPSASARIQAERIATHKARVQKVKVDPRLFGVHDSNLTSLNRRSTGSIRLWDTGTTWPAMQPTNGPVSFTRLDQIVRAAHHDGTEVTLVVALTPSWAAASAARAAPTDMPNLTAFKSYLSTVMAHYKNFFGPGHRGIANYQVWNEANISTFWTGTQAQMTQVVRAASQVRHQVDPGAHLIGPSMVARLAYQQKWIKQFYRLEVGRQPVWSYVDALGFSLYPTDTHTVGRRTRPAVPEDSIGLLRLVRGLLAGDKVPRRLPLWNNEVNYGLRAGATAGTAATPIPAARQVAYVMRTYLLNAAAGVKRVYWYAYDMGTIPGGGTLGNTLLTDPTDRAGGILTPAGKAFTRIQSWMAGTLVGTRTKAPCIADRHGTYTCVIRYKRGVGRVYWNAGKTVRVTLVRSARTKVNELGVTTKATGRSKISVDYRPVLVRSAR